MPHIAPFKAIRYSPEAVGDVSRVVAPPYDVISPRQQEALYAAHPQNCVRLILGKEAPTDSDADNRYTRAAAAMAEWRAAGILAEDASPAIYPYEQEFQWEGVRFARRGFLAALELSPFGQGQVFPHEFTMPGPKADRLALMKATGVNLSPIFGLFPDDGGKVAACLEAVWTGPAIVDVADDKGVRHRMWMLTDADLLERVAALMAPRPLYIADGHHRYETSCAYADWAEAQGQTSGDLHRYCIMMCVAMNDPGLVVLPTHRLLSGLRDLAAEDLVAALGDGFEAEALDEARSTPEAVTALLRERVGRHAFGLVCGAPAPGGASSTPEGGRATRAWVLALRDEAILDRRPGKASARWRRLDVAILADLIIEETIRGRLGRAVEVAYDHEAAGAWGAVTQGTCQMAVLMNPTPVEEVRAIAAGGERMPPKSTFFYPKLLSGLVFRRLR